ncbi:DNA topology modulation protein [Salirhabdus sp. Marseille-P4669]|uniref:DNA topology modulation protein n=1 Tax=Salirhabdus sp. Marseille-P4669 TaxID=2042310 RepID=UPI000C796C58|nr:DNA topology modulation protein [Salirhabdus sp. Marseille-P4669]
MKKIALIGSGGSGKSTFSKQLGAKFHIKVWHLDQLLWKSNWTPTSREEQIQIQKELVKEEEWIIDGNYNSTLDIRLEAADTILFFDLPRTVCVYRVLKRMIKYRNQTRPDMAEGCREKLDFHFLKWIWNFPKSKRPNLLRKLERLSKEKKVIIFKSSKDVKRFLQSC